MFVNVYQTINPHQNQPVTDFLVAKKKDETNITAHPSAILVNHPVFFMYCLFSPLLCNRGHYITNPSKALLPGTCVLDAPNMGNVMTPYKEPTPKKKNLGIM